MSNTAKTGLILLLVFVVLFLGLSIFLAISNQSLNQQNTALQSERDSLRKKEKALNQENGELKENKKALEENIKSLSAERENLGKQIADLGEQKRTADEQLQQAQAKADEMSSKVQEAEDSTEKYKKRLEEAQSAQEELAKKLKESQDAKPAVQEAPAPDASAASDGNAEYWAGVIKQKAALEVEVNKLKTELSDSSVKLVDLKQKSSDMSIQLDSLKAEKEQVEQEMRYKEEMVNNLSLELARSKNQKKEVETRLEQVGKDNIDLRKEMQRLIASKSALEKSVVQITQQKEQVQSELGKTESVIQSKIDEIWQIKDSLDKTIKNTSFNYPKDDKNGAVELPAIVVSSKPEAVSGHGISGKVVSVNEENHFVIIDAGENKGVALGDVFYVYKGQDQAARLEVIQVRKDISAADIKEQKVKISVGDTVR
ncbi:MAG: hypothetical protein HQL25_04155 [Candidatus Omnitrophica bacterium]|nr:hypothetical protein [Candidatus Omnitrophota bacterium]